IFTNTIPTKRTYERIDFYGESIVDSIHIKKELLSDSDIINKTTQPVYDEKTVLLGNMEDTLEAGSITWFVDNPLTSYKIR
ncbi:hypothetical protein, partial [Pseudomonas aeruginosa]|uniref:hypothetical protein n=1 Tax=Pseudomonas aeruginosa TaxID=287 RepID=UPI003459439B